MGGKWLQTEFATRTKNLSSAFNPIDVMLLLNALMLIFTVQICYNISPAHCFHPPLCNFFLVDIKLSAFCSCMSFDERHFRSRQFCTISGSSSNNDDDTTSVRSMTNRRSSGNYDDEDGGEEEEEDDDDTTLFAQSVFGTKKYWNEMYSGRGDFSSDQYSWYYGWETIHPFWLLATKLLKETDPSDSNSCAIGNNIDPKSQGISSTSSTPRRVLLPGIGNDSDLIYKLYTNGCNDITAIDYSPHAINRLLDYLPFLLPSRSQNIKLIVMDARYLESSWTNYFDIIVEKGTLDAIYLSTCNTDSKNLKLAISELYRVLRPGGVLLSISGVVPERIRRDLFSNDNSAGTSSCWEWIRDGSKDLQAGCFIFRKK